MLAALIGLVYLALGIFGFVRTGFGDFTGNQDVRVLGFAVNPLHNLVHVVAGALGLLSAASSASSRTFGWILLVVFGLVGVWGLMITGTISSNPLSGLGNPLNLNAADNWLHLATALLGLVMAIMPARKKIEVPGTASAPGTPDPRTERPAMTGDDTHGSGDTPTHPVPQQGAAPAQEHRPSRWKIHRGGRAVH